MNDVTFTMDQIRARTFELLGDAQYQTPQSLASYACGITDLILYLSYEAGDREAVPSGIGCMARETCLDKNGEARG